MKRFFLLGLFLWNISSLFARQQIDTLKEKVYASADQMPQYPGGMATLMKYLAVNLKYPQEDRENGIQGKIVARFIITRQGKVTNVNMIRGGDAALAAHVYHLLYKMPDWIPGQKDGKTVNVYFTLPVLVHPRE